MSEYKGVCSVHHHKSQVCQYPGLPQQQDLTDVNFFGVLYLEGKNEIMSTKELFLLSVHRDFRNLKTTSMHTHVHCKTTKSSCVNLVIFENRFKNPRFHIQKKHDDMYSGVIIIQNLKMRLEHRFTVPGRTSSQLDGTDSEPTLPVRTRARSMHRWHHHDKAPTYRDNPWNGNIIKNLIICFLSHYKHYNNAYNDKHLKLH